MLVEGVHGRHLYPARNWIHTSGEVLTLVEEYKHSALMQTKDWRKELLVEYRGHTEGEGVHITIQWKTSIMSKTSKFTILAIVHNVDTQLMITLD